MEVKIHVHVEAIMVYVICQVDVIHAFVQIKGAWARKQQLHSALLYF